MIIIGIDPALTITGYGVIKAEKGNFSVIEAGIIQTSPKEKLERRLDKLYKGIIKLISDTKPGCLVLEKLYAHYHHPATAFLLGHARGVICLACANKNIPLYEYGATRVKKAVVGKGLASKPQVQRMVAGILKLKCLPKYLDVTDALALAIAHSYIIKAKV
ncbi:MAG: crossover junction endodeoxyribonuclease RuvC [Candidatus Omnitrophica bacterium]|nr:crossover junction endodeoxyribonuclease RuvC [Candidatus Omnitrophota bacterium]MBU1870039.1 crossover junction endodeoxyribonuclease RuvC [Candidatus Omnitrophota bacterium]